MTGVGACTPILVVGCNVSLQPYGIVPQPLNEEPGTLQTKDKLGDMNFQTSFQNDKILPSEFVEEAPEKERMTKDRHFRVH